MSLKSIVSGPDALNVVQRGVDVRFCPQQLGQRDVCQSVIDYLVQFDNHWSNAAIAGVNARVEDACVTLAMRLGRLTFKNSYHLIQLNFRSRPCESVTTLSPAS